jgi:hypothetical protein
MVISFHVYMSANIHIVVLWIFIEHVQFVIHAKSQGGGEYTAASVVCTLFHYCVHGFLKNWGSTCIFLNRWLIADEGSFHIN